MCLKETAMHLNKTGLTSSGKLAFSFGNPGQDLNETAFQEWLRANFVRGANIAENSALKRLCFELPRFGKRGLRQALLDLYNCNHGLKNRNLTQSCVTSSERVVKRHLV